MYWRISPMSAHFWSLKPMRLVGWAFGAALVCSYAVERAHAGPDLVSEFGFVPPNDNFDSDGSRTIPSWAYGGDASVMQNYVRLTSDRAVRPTWRACRPRLLCLKRFAEAHVCGW
jgi:hypothetical protein